MKLSLAVILTLSLFTVLSCSRNNNKEDDVIYGFLEAHLKGLDPINAVDNYSSLMVSQVYEGLYHYHYLKRPLQLQPMLANGMPEVSSDGLTYRIKIKKGVYFQDSEAFPKSRGRELVAQDFIYSWKRLADAKNKAQGFWIFDNRIVGLNQWREALAKGQANYETPIEGLKAIDKYTLVIKLTQIFYQLPHLLAMPVTKVVAREAVEKYGPEFLNHPVGTGPFILESWIRNSKITFIANPNYRNDFYPNEGMPEDQLNGLLKDAGKKLPLSKKIEIREIVERQTTWLTFMKGDLDHTTIYKDAFDSFMKDGELSPRMKSKGIKVFIESRGGFTYEAMNMENDFFGKNRKIRQAIAHAFDKKTWINTFYDGRAIIAHGPIPPGITGYNSKLKSPYEYNPEKAKKLMAQAGYPNGKGLPTFRAELPSTAARTRQQAEFIKQQLSVIGIKLKLINNTWPQFDKKLKTKKAEYFTMAWTADYPDGQNFLQLFYSKNISPGPNATNFANRNFDKMYETALRLPPGEKKTELYQKMSQLITQEAPLIPMVHRTNYLPYHSWLKNYKENKIVPDFYKYLRVDGKQRALQKSKL